MSGRRSQLVYSTDHGRICAGCRRPETDCVCRDRSRSRNSDGVVRLHCETKGRKGAGMTRITGLPLSDVELAVLAKRLKSHCAVGGSVRDGVIELQGDQRDRLQSLLEAEGYTVRRAGG